MLFVPALAGIAALVSAFAPVLDADPGLPVAAFRGGALHLRRGSLRRLDRAPCSACGSMTCWASSATTSIAWFISATGCCWPTRCASSFLRVADARGFWGYFLPLDLTLSTSAIFELFEWAGRRVVRRRSRHRLSRYRKATNGTPRRTWRWPGWVPPIAMTVTLSINRRWQRDFNREWAESLRVKRQLPLGEFEWRVALRQPAGWCGRKGSNLRHRRCKRRALPLSYARDAVTR